MKHTYACSDFHGNLVLCKKVLDFLEENDTLYFLGDANDRGEHGVEIMQMLLADPRVIYIKGNHEDFFEKCALNVINEDYHSSRETIIWASLNNGGSSTIEKLIYLINNGQKDIVYKLKHAIEKLPYRKTYINKKGQTIHLSHAGFSYLTRNVEDLLWDRSHFYMPLELGEHEYVVHGHTPAQFLKAKLEGKGEEGDWETPPTIIRYCDGHKIDLDMGTPESNRIALLDLDTFYEIYFDGEDEND